MLEEWGAGTFNVDAVAADSADRASVLHSTLKDSVDIQLDSGEAYSAKSYVTAEKTAKAQARFSPESGHASYHDQGRLVPSDQLSDAKATAHREALRNQPIRSDVSDAYAETESRLTDTIKNEKGVSSKSASRKELEDIAHESKEQKFKAEDHGVTADSAINTEYMLKQALKAGYTTAAITVAFQLAPEIYKAIDFLIKHLCRSRRFPSWLYIFFSVDYVRKRSSWRGVQRYQSYRSWYGRCPCHADGKEQYSRCCRKDEYTADGCSLRGYRGHFRRLSARRTYRRHYRSGTWL